MAKNPRLSKSPKTEAGALSSAKYLSLSPNGKKWLIGGVVTVIAGFWLLTFTDPSGQNWASTLSPLLLVGGYICIGIGLVIPAPRDAATNESPASNK